MPVRAVLPPIKVRRLPITGWGGLCRPCAAEVRILRDIATALTPTTEEAGR